MLLQRISKHLGGYMNNISQAHVSDGYKLGHAEQYITGTNLVYSNMTPRSNHLARIIYEDFNGKVVFFGLQYALIEMNERWKRTFFDLDKGVAVNKFARRVKNYLGTDHGDSLIEKMGGLHDLGYLPVQIKALPEGSRVNMQVPVFTIVNTHPDFFWLVNYLETYLSCQVWPMCNAASLAEQYKLASMKYGDITSDDPSFWVGIANHCFAARGHRGTEDAMMSGMAHLTSSFGTDTLWAIDAIEEYYGANSDEELIGISVNATEHATVTQRISYYRDKGFDGMGAEVESIRNLCTTVYPKGILSYVADSEDYFGLLEKGLPQLVDTIKGRSPDSNGLIKFVVRPDSSPKTPLEVICGDSDAPEGSAENKGSLQLLWEVFGGNVNNKGFKVIDPSIGLIYGEAISLKLQSDIYEKMIADGWCVTNVLFGVGSWAFLEASSRDSYGFAIKAVHSEIEGVGCSMQKTPKTAMSFKKSAKGLLRVEKEGDNFILIDQVTKEQEEGGELATVFLDGVLMREQTFGEIREVLWG
jgi:nicotinamide phosphoribosyltransferase